MRPNEGQTYDKTRIQESGLRVIERLIESFYKRNKNYSKAEIDFQNYCNMISHINGMKRNAIFQRSTKVRMRMSKRTMIS